jgi:hypothetical protein
MSVEGGFDFSKNTTSSDDEEEDTYVPSPQGRGKGIAGGSGSSSRAAEIQEEEEEGEEEEDVFDVEEITPSSYMHMGIPIFRQPQNPDWREKISYKGKTDLVREKRKVNSKLVEKEVGIDYMFHTTFQHDFYESVISPKNKWVALS